LQENWITNEEEEQITKEYRYLNSIEPITKSWRDLAWMYFKPIVLDKYKNNSSCEIGEKYITFLQPGGNDDLTVHFELINGKLMVQSKYYCFVPPKERKHWEKYQLQEDIETTDDNYFK
jgi:hypothetical protein